MTFDLHGVPFSTYGSCFAFSQAWRNAEAADDVFLRLIHGIQDRYTVQLVRGGKPVPFEAKASASLLRLEAREGYAEICIHGPHIIRIRGANAVLRLLKDDPEKYCYAMPSGDGRWEINGPAGKLMLVPMKGALHVDAPWDAMRSTRIVADFTPPAAEGGFECRIEEFLTVWKEPTKLPDFDAARAAIAADFAAWTSRALPVPPEYESVRELAVYITWSCMVRPQGNLKRPTMYMSKNWMTNVWSWDHCFNAKALAKGDPGAAWDQFMLMFDHQDPDGAIPDCFNDRLFIWSFSKPPIHGWTLGWMMDRGGGIEAAKLSEAYGPLCRWTEWWFTYRDDNGNGIPQYNHGNDSGWDNGTVFRDGVPVELPDLTAFLVLQMDALARVAGVIGKTDESSRWKERADRLLGLLLAHFWKGDRFVAYHNDGREVRGGDSLMLSLPLLLGRRLPQLVVSALVAGLKREGRFLTDNGLATESIGSPLYTPDGYWRGPIWAPPTFMMVEALAMVGEEDFAKDIARRFCRTFARSGAAENYDALTGEGLRDRAYTWTSSVFLLLAVQGTP